MTTVTEAPPVGVGTIFASSWGWDQTQVDFYEVVGMTPSGKSVRVVRIGAEVVEGDAHSERVRARPGSAKPDAEVMTKRLQDGGRMGAAFKVASYANAYQTTAEATHYRTGPYGGR